jgi:hypothetical protein
MKNKAINKIKSKGSSASADSISMLSSKYSKSSTGNMKEEFKS